MFFHFFGTMKAVPFRIRNLVSVSEKKSVAPDNDGHALH
jgi:hypothetical protein